MRKANDAASGICIAILITSLALLSVPGGFGLPASAHGPELVTGSWTSTGDLTTPRYNHTATLLPNGKVLVAGGAGPTSCSITPVSSAELYDPVSGTWSATGNLNTARAGHTATLLVNGQVLVAGGYAPRTSLDSAELYDPTTGAWRPTASFNTIRAHGSATLLPNGKVLAIGLSGGNSVAAELYDPATGSWSSTGAPSFGTSPQTVLLANGNVLAVEEGSPWGYGENVAALYDPATGQWNNAGFVTLFWAPTMTLLRNGNVLVTGLYGANFPTQAMLYDSHTGRWSVTGNLTTFRHYGGYTATLLADGKVLLAGGSDYPADQPVIAEELYDPDTRTWTMTSRLINGRSSHTATLLLNGKVLVAGGASGVSCNTPIHRSAEIYDPGVNATTNPIDDSQFLVRQHYLDFLNREPDQGGWDYWTARITECSNNPLCVHQRRIDVSAAFFIELEFQRTGYVVYRLHRAAHGVISTCLGPEGSQCGDSCSAPCELRSRAKLIHSQFVADRAQLRDGPDLPQDTINFANAFVLRPEFRQVYPETFTASEFVNKLFDTANLTGSSNSQYRQAAIEALQNGTRTRAQVLLDLIDIDEFKQREYNPAFVLMQYFGYLRRDPEENGYFFWLDVLNNRVPGNFRSMVCAFLTSAEYQRRFGTALTRTNSDCAQN